jgi:hypothetical protein
MVFFSKLKKESREQEVEVKVNSILTSISLDFNNFTYQEQAGILVKAIERFKEIKTEEKNEALKLINEIDQSLEKLIFQKV